MNSLSSVTLQDIAEHQPALHQVNNSITTDQVIHTTTDLIHRIFSTLYMLDQSFAPRIHLPETPLLFQTALSQFVIDISKTYPDMLNFDVSVVVNEQESFSVVGKNDFTNSLLNMIYKVATTPVLDNNPTGDNLQPPQFAQVNGPDEDDDDDDFFEEDDDYYN